MINVEMMDLLNKALCPAYRNRLLGLLKHERQRLARLIVFKRGARAGIDYAVKTCFPDTAASAETRGTPPAERGDA